MNCSEFYKQLKQPSRGRTVIENLGYLSPSNNRQDKKAIYNKQYIHIVDYI